jgi:hypothetical protein
MLDRTASSGNFSIQRQATWGMSDYVPDPEVHGYPSNLDYFNAQ